MTINTGIYLYNDVEVLDFAGPFEVFSTSARVKFRQDNDENLLFNVFTIGETAEPIIARGGLCVTPEYKINNHPLLDLLIIPGGIIADEIAKNHVIQWIKDCTENTRITASVCTGAFLLAKAGLLDEKFATTHFEDIKDLETQFPHTKVKRNSPWVDQGDIVTSAGISAGIDMSLYLVSKLENKKLAMDTARQMEYTWQQI